MQPNSDWHLHWNNDMLCCTNSAQSYHVDFLNPAFQHRIKSLNKKDPLIRALGLHKSPDVHVIDTTAGFGQDGVCISTYANKVTLLEQSALVHALLQNGLERASNWLAKQKAKIELHHINACDYLSKLNKSEYPDVIYLDPMYPERSKQALSKLPMQCLQTITSPQNDIHLFQIALVKALKRTVIKRPNHAIFWGKPDLSLKGKSHRFDIYLSLNQT